MEIEKIKLSLHNSKKSSTFVADSDLETIINHYIDMNILLKNLGAILVLLGVICLAVYYFGFQVNGLLVASMALEVAGLFAYILVNKRLS